MFINNYDKAYIIYLHYSKTSEIDKNLITLIEKLLSILKKLSIIKKENKIRRIRNKR